MSEYDIDTSIELLQKNIELLDIKIKALFDYQQKVNEQNIVVHKALINYIDRLNDALEDLTGEVVSPRGTQERDYY